MGVKNEKSYKRYFPAEVYISKDTLFFEFPEKLSTLASLYIISSEYSSEYHKLRSTDADNITLYQTYGKGDSNLYQCRLGRVLFMANILKGRLYKNFDYTSYKTIFEKYPSYIRTINILKALKKGDLYAAIVLKDIEFFYNKASDKLVEAIVEKTGEFEEVYKSLGIDTEADTRFAKKEIKAYFIAIQQFLNKNNL